MAVLYAVAAAVLWRDVSLASGSVLGRAVMAPPVALHAWLLSRALFADGALHLGLGPALSLIIFLTALIYWIASFRGRLGGLQVLICAAAVIVLSTTMFLPSGKALLHANMPLFRAHLLLSIVSYSLFTIASLQALLMATLERRLHGTTLPVFLQHLPPLLSLEALLFRILWAGFILLSLSLVTGMVFAEELTGKPLAFTHKILFGFISWIIFAALLAGRAKRGWRGRVALRWTLSGFLALVLAYLGTKFVLEVILNR